MSAPTLASVASSIYVHYAASPIVGDWVLPSAELPEELGQAAGHFGKVHEGRPPGQYRPYLVYVHKLVHGYERWADLAIGAAYASEASWVHEVEPEGPLGILSSRATCRRRGRAGGPGGALRALARSGGRDVRSGAT